MNPEDMCAVTPQSSCLLILATIYSRLGSVQASRRKGRVWSLVTSLFPLFFPLIQRYSYLLHFLPLSWESHGGVVYSEQQEQLNPTSCKAASPRWYWALISDQSLMSILLDKGIAAAAYWTVLFSCKDGFMLMPFHQFLFAKAERAEGAIKPKSQWLLGSICIKH